LAAVVSGGAQRSWAARLISWGYAAVIIDLPERIGIIGFSHGGSATLFTTLASEVTANRGGQPFVAAVAYYPSCKTDLQGGTLATRVDPGRQG
jgi:hypothetical protein